jgi:hypothetical protein
MTPFIAAVERPDRADGMLDLAVQLSLEGS